MPIASNIDPSNDLTIFTAEDSPSFEEFMKAVRDFYDGDPTMNVLWNLGQGAGWDLSGEHLQQLANYAPRLKRSLDGAKTAFVASDELSDALSKLFILFGQSPELKIQMQIFSTIEEALNWIKS